MTALPLVVTKGPTLLWYLTRGTGIVAMVVLTVVLLAGILTTTGWSAPFWPRFFSRTLHRNLSLFALVLVAVHVVTTVVDGFVPISFLDAAVPFRSPYRTFWLGLGTIALDLLVVLLVTSALRYRIGSRTWRGVHWLAYLAWPLALLHSAGIGTDARLGVVQLVGLVCTGAVVAAGAYRVYAGPAPVQARAGRTRGWYPATEPVQPPGRPVSRHGGRR